MKLPLPTYGRFVNLPEIAEVIHMFRTKIDDVIKSLITEPNMQFHSKNHMIQLVMYHAGLFMSEESYKDVETYLGEGADTLLRDFGVGRL
ncbi:hypothetical protein D3C77_300000 [compost metagenome]